VAFEVFTITPWVAERIVERRNRENRPTKPGKITEFSADMADEQWKFTGDTLKFSDNKILRDGQNRLYACIRSGKPFTTLIVFGIEDDVFPWMDRGKPRSGADSLHILGVENANCVQGAVRWIELIRTGRGKDRATFTPKEIIDIFNDLDRERLKDAIVLARKVYNADRTPMSLATALAYLFGESGGGLRDRFFDAWATGNFAKPMTTLRACTQEIQAIRGYSHGRIHDVVRAAMWIITWNHVVTRSTRINKDTLLWKTTERFPEIRGA
jgi:hypothetical protein